MNTFKSFCMLLVLMGVGYGVYRGMHLKNPVAAPQGIDTSIPEIDLQMGSTADPGVAPRFSEAAPPTREPRREGLIGRPFEFGTTAPREPKTETPVAPPSVPETPVAGSLLPPSKPLDAPKYDPPLTTPSLTTSSLPNPPVANAAMTPPSTTLTPIAQATPPTTQNMSEMGTLPAGGSLPPYGTNAVVPATSLSPAVMGEPKKNANESLSPFGPVLRETQTLIEQRKLAEALQRLTRIYDDQAMTEAERVQVLDLLNQLAGTVIYSREYWLGAGHTVAAGQTLESIAKEKNVPWELLAKINGLVDPKQLTPGEMLKVVPGPFRAEISLSSKRMTLFLNDMYAGSFEIVNLGRESQYGESDYLVKKRAMNPLYDNAAQGQRFAEGDPQNPLGNFAVMLADGLAIHGHGKQVAPQDPRGSLRLSESDCEDVHDILSEGSKVTIKR
ncbi:MAG: LysM peptidoglycan-binding domain-containing protein [Pirellulales bacterium]